MRSIRVVFVLRFFEFKAHGADGVCEKVRPVIEFLLEGSVSAFNAAVVCWLARGQDDERDLRSLQVCSNSAINSEPPSTWMDLTGKGILSINSIRNRLADEALALE